ncbi:MAG: hypothetical protein AAGA12_02290 [Pseudomonadota bacterium]
MLSYIENTPGAFGRAQARGSTMRRAVPLQDLTNKLEERPGIVTFQPEWEGAEHNTLDRLIKRSAGQSFVVVSATGCGLFDTSWLGDILDPVKPGQPISRIMGAAFWACLNRIADDYRVLLEGLHQSNPKLQIILHAGSEIFLTRDFMFERALKSAGLNLAQDRAVARRWIIHHFNRCLAELSRELRFNSQVGYVELSDIGRVADDWHEKDVLSREARFLIVHRFDQEIARRSARVVADLAPKEADQICWTVADNCSRALVECSIPALIGELGARLEQLGQEPARAHQPDTALTLNVPKGLETTVTERTYMLGLRRLQIVQTELADQVCLSNPDDVHDVTEALNSRGPERMRRALLRWLISGPFEVPWSVATPLAALLVKRAGQRDAKAVLRGWSSQIGSVQA